MKSKLNLIAAAAVVLMFAMAAFADIRPMPMPTPQPAPSVAPANTTEAQVTISASRWNEEGTLVITRAMLDKLNAAAQTDKPAAPASAFANQTIVGGIFLSLALVFGGVWLARSKGPISTPAIGIVVLAILGMGSTIAIGNIAPPQRVPLDSGILDKKLLGRYIASGTLKVKIVDYKSRDEIMLALPAKKEGTTGDEE